MVDVGSIRLHPYLRLEEREDQRWPADLYLEGLTNTVDGSTHRSEACGTRGRAPYDGVLHMA